MTTKTSPICYGIDLGTTNSCISAYCSLEDDSVWKNPDVVQNKGEQTTPSTVCFDDSQILVGTSAVARRELKPESTFFCIKRFLGRKTNDESIKNDIANFPFETFPCSEKDHNEFSIHTSDPNEKRIILKVNTKRYCRKEEGKEPQPIEVHPIQISGLVLKTLKEAADDRFGKKSTKKCVITVPANFNNEQRLSTKIAAKIAGLDIVDTISEPIAASITYAYTKQIKKESNIIVYDFGGGTLDVALVNIKGGEFTVIATSGNLHFGGEDIDQYILKEQIEEINRRYEVNISGKKSKGLDVYKSARSQLLKECKIAKEKLSRTASSIEINLSSLFKKGSKFIDYESVVNKSSINDFLDKQIDQITGPVEAVLRDADIKIEEIEEIILVGGSSHIPHLVEIFEEKFHKKPFFPVNQDEAISTGAAIYGAYKINKKVKGFDSINISEVTPMNLSFVTTCSDSYERGLYTLIPRNTKIPCETEKWRKFNTKVESLDKNYIELCIYEGNEYKSAYEVGSFIYNFKTKNLGEKSVNAKLFVTSEGIEVKCYEINGSDTEKSASNEVFSRNKNIYSDSQITKMANDIKEWTSVVDKTIVYIEPLVSVLGLFSKPFTLKMFKAGDKDKIKKEVEKLKNSSREKNSIKMLTKEDAMEYVNRMEDFLKKLNKDYKRPKRIIESEKFIKIME